MEATEAGRERKGPLYRKTPEADRYLGAVQGRQKGGNWTKDGSHRLTQGPSCGHIAREGSVDER